MWPNRCNKKTLLKSPETNLKVTTIALQNYIIAIKLMKVICVLGKSKY